MWCKLFEIRRLIFYVGDTTWYSVFHRAGLDEARAKRRWGWIWYPLAANFASWVGACMEIVGPFQEPPLCNWSPSIFDAWAASAHGCLVTWDTTEAKVQSWKKSYHKTTLRPINLAIVSDPTVRLTRQRGSYPALYPVLSSIVWLKKRCKKLLHSKFVLTIHSQILSFVQRLSQKEGYKKITSLLYTPSKK